MGKLAGFTPISTPAHQQDTNQGKDGDDSQSEEHQDGFLVHFPMKRGSGSNQRRAMYSHASTTGALLAPGRGRGGAPGLWLRFPVVRCLGLRVGRTQEGWGKGAGWLGLEAGLSSCDFHRPYMVLSSRLQIRLLSGSGLELGRVGARGKGKEDFKIMQHREGVGSTQSSVSSPQPSFFPNPALSQGQMFSCNFKLLFSFQRPPPLPLQLSKQNSLARSISLALCPPLLISLARVLSMLQGTLAT